jgi:hypothetical protein
MPMGLVGELTGARLPNAKLIARHVFSWLLPDDFPPRRSEGLDGSEIELLLARAKLGKAQELALWSYIYCVSRSDPADSDVRERAEDLLDQLLIRPSHKKAIRAKMDAALKMLSPVPDAATLLKRPPRNLVSAITQAVVECAKDWPTERQILFNLRADEFEHSSDRDSLALIRNLPPDLVAKVTDIIKRGVEVDVMANGLLVTEDSLPWLHRLYKEAALVLDVSHPPPLYLRTGGLRAYTVGIEEPMIVVESMTASLLDAREVVFLLGRELGHVMAGHVQGRSLTEVILGLVAQVTFGDLLAAALRLKLYSWLRYTEFTADRAGYLACQNLEAALRLLLKFSGFPVRHYNEMHPRSLIEQAQAFQDRLNDSSLDRMFSVLGTVGKENNLTVVRAKQLTDWVGDGHADLIIQKRA